MCGSPTSPIRLPTTGWPSTSFSIKGPHHTRRPDIILFLNGLPLVVLELKNPADEQADIWKAFEQLQTYKAQIPTCSSTTRSWLSPMAARRAWVALGQRRALHAVAHGGWGDPRSLGQFGELETLVRGILAPAPLLDYVRFFVLFEEDGALVKKIAGYHQYHAVRSGYLPGGAGIAARGLPQGGVVAHPGQRQEHHHDLLCGAGHAGDGDG